MAPNTTRPLCTLVLPGHFGFVADRVAEEFGNVMPEDDATTRSVLYGRHASPFVRRAAVTPRLYGIDTPAFQATLPEKEMLASESG